MRAASKLLNADIDHMYDRYLNREISHEEYKKFKLHTGLAIIHIENQV